MYLSVKKVPPELFYFQFALFLPVEVLVLRTDSFCLLNMQVLQLQPR